MISSRRHRQSGNELRAGGYIFSKASIRHGERAVVLVAIMSDFLSMLFANRTKFLKIVSLKIGNNYVDKKLKGSCAVNHTFLHLLIFDNKITQ